METGATYPDIELLPAIAEYFSVTIEHLLGVEKASRDAKAAEYKLRFKEAITHGLIDEGIGIARAAVRDFPTNWEMQNQLMYILFVATSDDGNIPNWRENTEKYKDEIIAIGNRIIENCTDDAIRLEAKSRLGFHYCEIGEFERGKAIFESLPTIDSCRETMIYWALRGEERKQHNREMLSRFLSAALWNLWAATADSDGEPSDGKPKEMIEQLLKYEQIIRVVYDDGDLGDRNLGLAQLCFYKLAPLALECGDTDDMFAYMERGVGYMKAYALLPEKYYHTSYLVKGVCDERYCDTADSRPANEIILERSLGDPIYDGVRTDARFERIRAELENIHFAE